MIFGIGLLTTYIEDRKSKKKDKVDENPTNYKASKPSWYRIILISGDIIILIASYLSFKSYNIFYEDHFTKVRLFKEDKTYSLEDVESFTVSSAKRYELKNFSMKLYMEDGKIG